MGGCFEGRGKLVYSFLLAGLFRTTTLLCSREIHVKDAAAILRRCLLIIKGRPLVLHCGNFDIATEVEKPSTWGQHEDNLCIGLIQLLCLFAALNDFEIKSGPTTHHRFA